MGETPSFFFEKIYLDIQSKAESIFLEEKILQYKTSKDLFLFEKYC